MLDRQIERSVGGMQIAQSRRPVGQTQDRHLTEHRCQPPLVALLHTRTRDLLVADNQFQGLLTNRAQGEMIIQQAPQQLAPVAVKALLKLAMRQTSSVAPVQETHQRRELLTASAKPSRRAITRPATAVNLTDDCTITTSFPGGEDFIARRVTFTSTGVEVGGHAGHLSWSTLDISNADFDTLLMTPGPRHAPPRRAPPRPANAPKPRGTQAHGPQPTPITTNTLTTQPAATPHENAKPARFQGLLRRHRSSRRSLQKSRPPAEPRACRRFGRLTRASAPLSRDDRRPGPASVTSNGQRPPPPRIHPQRTRSPQKRHGLRALRRGAIGVQGEGLRGALLLRGSLLDQRCRELPVLAVLDRPADDVPAEHVEDHVQVVVGPLRWALQLRHVPAPQLIRSLGQQLRLRVRRVGELSAPVPHPTVVGGEDPVHRADRAQVGALVQQRRVGLLGGGVNEPLAVQYLEHPLALGLCERSLRHRPRPGRSRSRWPPPAVDRGWRRPERSARRPGPDQRGQLLNGGGDHRSVLLGALSVPSISSNSAETFPWISTTRFIFASSASERSSLRCNPTISWSRRSTGLRPRDLPSSFSAPSLRCLRQYVKCDV